MLALVKPTAGPGLELMERDRPHAGAGEVVLAVLRSGICGTDLHIEAWDDFASANVSPGRVLGHELVGQIIEVGDGVRDLSLGEIASPEGHLVCGRCRNCRAGRRHLCERTLGLGVGVDGGFAEFVVVPASNVWVHRELSGLATDDPRRAEGLDVAAIFDPFGNAVHTALKFPLLGEDVLVTGAGPIGVMAAMVAKHAGARHVVITDVSHERLALAREAGVSLALDVTTTRISEAMAAVDMSEGFDVGLEMSGQPAALTEMIANMRHGGNLAILGLPAAEVTVDMSAIVTKMLTLSGIYGREMFETWYAMSVLQSAGLDIAPVITHRFGYADFELAFATARSGRCGKVLLDWTTPHLPKTSLGNDSDANVKSPRPPEQEA